MNLSKQSATRLPGQESETLRALRLKFHSYSKSQQISSMRPSAEATMKSTLKENEAGGWRHLLKSPTRQESRFGAPVKQTLTQKVNNVAESEFTRKARELLARSLSKRPTGSTGPANPQMAITGGFSSATFKNSAGFSLASATRMPANIHPEISPVAGSGTARQTPSARLQIERRKLTSFDSPRL